MEENRFLMNNDIEPSLYNDKDKKGMLLWQKRKQQTMY